MRKLIVSLITAAAIAATAGPAFAQPPDPSHAQVRVAASVGRIVPRPCPGGTCGGHNV